MVSSGNGENVRLHVTNTSMASSIISTLTACSPLHVCAPVIEYGVVKYVIYVSCILKESEAAENGNTVPPTAAAGESYWYNLHV